MKFSEQWLRTWVNPQVSREELVARLSMVGLEVDAVVPVAGEFSGVVVGEVVSAEQHPDADKLRVCQVSNGREVLQVVCGAPNVRAGLKVPFAMINGPKDPFINHEYCRTFGYGHIWGGEPQNVAEAGHAPFLEDHETFNRMLREFLTWTKGAATVD